MSVVLVGTSDAGRLAVQSDAPMSSRFPSVELPRWSESEEFRSFVHAFERLLPLKKPSNLAQRDCVRLMLGATGGITGSMAQMLNLRPNWRFEIAARALDWPTSSMRRPLRPDGGRREGWAPRGSF